MDTTTIIIIPWYIYFLFRPGFKERVTWPALRGFNEGGGDTNEEKYSMKHFFNISIFLFSLSMGIVAKAMDVWNMAQVIMPSTHCYSSTMSYMQYNSDQVPPHVYNNDIGSIQATILTLTGTIALSWVSIYYLYDRIKCTPRTPANTLNDQCKGIRNAVKTTSFTRGRKRAS